MDKIVIPTTYTDEKYAEAEKHVRASKTGISIPMLGRLLGIGYNRAERLMWALIANGVVFEDGHLLKLVK